MIADLYILDTGPLGLITNPKESDDGRRCKEWMRSALAAGARVMVPEVADYELRRELIRTGKTKGLARLDTIPGTVPHPLHLPSGCHFRTRCPWAIEKCALEEPPLMPVAGPDPGHTAACLVMPSFDVAPPTAASVEGKLQ